MRLQPFTAGNMNYLMNGWRTISLAMAASSIALAHGQSESLPGFEEQDFLFLTEEAYTQEASQWQVGLSAGFFNHLVETRADDEQTAREETDQTPVNLEIEYGITDRLQVDLTVPYLWERVAGDDAENTENGIGDIEFGIAYAFVKEKDGPVEFTAGMEISAPTGDEGDGLGAGSWGWGAFAALSKRLAEKLYVHARVGYSLTGDAVQDGEEVDERELEYGLAVVYRPVEHIDLIAELVGERSQEKDAERNEDTTHPIYLLTGIKYERDNDLQLGLGVPVGLSKDSFDAGAIVKVQYEFR